jgi:hypothetical protein
VRACNFNNGAHDVRYYNRWKGLMLSLHKGVRNSCLADIRKRVQRMIREGVIDGDLLAQMEQATVDEIRPMLGRGGPLFKTVIVEPARVVKNGPQFRPGTIFNAGVWPNDEAFLRAGVSWVLKDKSWSTRSGSNSAPDPVFVAQFQGVYDLVKAERAAASENDDDGSGTSPFFFVGPDDFAAADVVELAPIGDEATSARSGRPSTLPGGGDEDERAARQPSEPEVRDDATPSGPHPPTPQAAAAPRAAASRAGTELSPLHSQNSDEDAPPLAAGRRPAEARKRKSRASTEHEAKKKKEAEKEKKKKKKKAVLPLSGSSDTDSV